MEPDIPLGRCCACSSEEATVILTLDKKAPIAGTGWGCFVCGLTQDGAIAVVCDKCNDPGVPLRFACVGPPERNNRAPFESLAGTHQHDLFKHFQINHVCIGCGCTEADPCNGGCYWLARNSQTAEGVCSNCAAHLKHFEYQFFPSSPDVGQPDCICSLCEQHISMREDAILRMHSSAGEARFHKHCAQVLGIIG